MQGQETGVSGQMSGKSGACSLLRACLAWFSLFFFLLVPGLPAQTTSTITGTVRDKQGLAVTGAEVHAAARNWPSITVSPQR